MSKQLEESLKQTNDLLVRLLDQNNQLLSALVYMIESKQQEEDMDEDEQEDQDGHL